MLKCSIHFSPINLVNSYNRGSRVDSLLPPRGARTWVWTLASPPRTLPGLQPTGLLRVLLNLVSCKQRTKFVQCCTQHDSKVYLRYNHESILLLQWGVEWSSGYDMTSVLRSQLPWLQTLKTTAWNAALDASWVARRKVWGGRGSPRGEARAARDLCSPSGAARRYLHVSSKGEGAADVGGRGGNPWPSKREQWLNCIKLGRY